MYLKQLLAWRHADIDNTITSGHNMQTAGGQWALHRTLSALHTVNK